MMPPAERTIKVDDYEPATYGLARRTPPYQWMPKGPTEDLDYALDISARLAVECDTIWQVEAAMKPSNLPGAVAQWACPQMALFGSPINCSGLASYPLEASVAKVRALGTVVILWIVGGVPGRQKTTVRVIVQTRLGRRHEVNIGLPILATNQVGRLQPPQSGSFSLPMTWNVPTMNFGKAANSQYLGII